MKAIDVRRVQDRSFFIHRVSRCFEQCVTFPDHDAGTKQHELFAPILTMLQCVTFPDHDARTKQHEVFQRCFRVWPSLTTMFQHVAFPDHGAETKQHELFAQILTMLQCVAFPNHDAGTNRHEQASAGSAEQ